MVCIHSIQSSPLSDDYTLENDSPTMIIHPYKFISLMCQQQEQYPTKLTRKLCSNYLQFDKAQDQQQRGKRVGWTISV